ncbi:helix-turn-helix domain-containing protein [Methylobacterium sp. J-030]|uniref:helix-turn-helix domain-containing protein n=1 Tax=Methylobacterium sp. J-030 TaxID=2836627 RepID=UPI001FB8F735|nr:helix-turn-helix transcriptional regulator [Methylobacterium sp. J-030]MCJ2069326.1 helix-turn-helix domain-containing protein [Methylobacterium sp. J-030]
MVVTGEQLRGARAMARIEQSELAQKAGVSVDTIKRLERTVGPISANVNTMASIVQVLEAAGLEFIPENVGGEGIRFRKRRDGTRGGHHQFDDAQP